METLTAPDLHFVVGRIPRDVRSLMMRHRLILAGGFIRSTITGEKVADVDIFGATNEALKLAALELTTARKGRFLETKNALTVLTPSRAPVQFITRWLFDNPAACVASFDFTIAQSAVWWEPAAEGAADAGRWQSACAEAFYADLAARRLVYTSPDRNEDAGGSLMRMRKFLARGYSIQAPSMGSVIARLISRVNFDTGLAAQGEAGVARILTGLLREVDPLIVVDGVDVLDEHEADVEPAAAGA